ncbi:type I polyketide synthase [Sorangium cellulosum]|uniref:type I polyketide synthase n=1 Tax=Sorangium cellulosum TaxID=56 RepID=UPI001331335C|nr:type I polyketide synthase [Sorangium cellulosum]
MSSTSSDIALIGMACRFPGGANSPEAFWSFLLAGGDGIVPVPEDRWDNKAYFDPDREKKNRMYVDRGGFVDGIDQFDPLFFGISPAEASVVDPQHRWLLEVTYEALENAGLSARALRGSDTAVYVGQFMHDYEQLQLDAMAHGLITSHSATGTSMTLTSNRISYAFDFRGPSVTLDTACSSSLVALDLACKALLDGDCRLAVAGGANLLLRPELTMSICKASMLSPDGKCKSFDKAANGYVRSEGAGVVLLKKLADAQRDGDPILAVIKASGVNQDGHTVGITVPSGDAQRALLRRSLDRAGIDGAEIQYAEAHGTGTAVGDPIEVGALGDVLGARRDDAAPCVIGSVKSNIGHLESAAGVAGLIKTVMAMNHGVIPGNLHFHEINPAIDLQALRLRVAASQLPWPDTKGGTRKAIVNSFGFGGTNANVVVEEPPRAADHGATQAPVVHGEVKVLVVSSKTEQGLKQLAARYAAFLASTAAAFRRGEHGERGEEASRAELHHICYTAAVRREHHRHRLAVTGSSATELQHALESFVEGRPSTVHVSGRAPEEGRQRLCFVFSGMGTQWAGMGRALYDTEPAFRAAFDRCSAALQVYTGWSLIDRVLAAGDKDGIADTAVAQPAIFAVQVALSELLKTWGIAPSAVIGHSAGEVSAAYVAGALSFEDAVLVVYHRSRLQATTEGMGRMLAVGLSEARLPAYIAGLEAKVSVAAINSDDAITLAGDAEALSAIAERLEAEGVFARFLKVGVPYHSPVMDHLKEPLIQALGSIVATAPHTPLYSTVSGELTRPGDWGAAYWPRNVRDPVLFKAAIQAAARDGARVFLEVAPHAALASSIEKNLAQSGVDGAVVTTLRRDQDDVAMLARTLGSLHASGHEVDFRRLYPRGGRLVSLPNYVWQHATYWREAEEVRRARLKNVSHRGGVSTEGAHPLLGGKLSASAPLWQHALDVQEQRYLADHQVEGDPVYPGAGYVEMALAVAAQRYGRDRITLENITFKRALFLDRDRPTLLESSVGADESSLVIRALDVQSGQWMVHSEAVLVDVAPAAPARDVPVAQLRDRCPSPLDKAAFYDHCRRLGLSYEGHFQAVQRAWVGEGEILVEIAAPEHLAAASEGYLLHPVLLDAALQALLPAVDTSYLPVKIAALHYHRRPSPEAYCHAKITHLDAGVARGDLVLTDRDGAIAVEVRGIELKATRSGSAGESDAASLLYHFCWEERADVVPEDAAAAAAPGTWIVLSDNQGIGPRVARELERRQQSALLVDLGSTEGGASGVRREIRSSDDLVPLLEQCAMTCRGILYLRGLDVPPCEELTAPEVLASCRDTAVVPLLVAQALDRVSWRSPPAVYLVSRGAHQIEASDPAPQPAQGALWGFGRVFASESPAHASTLVDLAEHVDDGLVAAFVRHLLHGAYEQEIALRPGALYSNRLKALGEGALSEYAEQERLPARGRPYRLASHPRSAEGRRWIARTFTLPAPDPGVVTLKVERAALAQRDVERLIQAHGEGTAATLRPVEAGCGCVGIVTQAGPGCRTFAPGSEVVGFAGPGLASHGQAREELLAHKPSCLSADEAVLLPAAYLVAHYALARVANLLPGETVLVHEGADAVGLAAIQLARRAGATVFASARTAAKRARLRAQDVALVMDSTTYTFVDEILAATGGRGVDVALNLLGGQFVSKTLAVLKPMGRFVELGRAPIPSNAALLQQIVARNLSYRGVDLDVLIAENPALCGQLLRELCALFERGELEPIRVRSFPSADVDAAVASLGDDEGSGAIGVAFDSEAQRVAPGLDLPVVDARSTYLVTGGLGALGLEVLRWLVAAGARSVVLVGRSDPAESALAAIDWARAQGAAVTTMRADVADPDDVSRVLGAIAERLPPLGGVVHAAGVLDDGVIAHQSEQRFERVLAPKIKGAWNLHRQTAHLELDLFVLFSSIASVVGWAGQSNYAAANAFMDTLAHHRRAAGKPALSINWGPWAGAGMAASLDARDLRRMKEAGLAALDAPAALSAMERLLRAHVPQAGVFEVDWSSVFKHEIDPARKTVFRSLISASSPGAEADFMEKLSAAPAAEQLPLLAGQVSSQLAAVLGLESASGVDRGTSVFDYGVNSLMAMDLLSRLQAVMKMKLPATLVHKHPTVDAMARCIAEQMTLRSAADSGDVLYWDPRTPDVVVNREVNGRLATLNTSVLHWMHEGHTAHFNVGALLEIDPARFDLRALKTTLDILFTHHDGCRVQIVPGDAGMQAEIVPLGDGVHIAQHDLRGLGYEAGVARMTELNDALHASLTFRRGDPLYRAAYYQIDDATPHRFFLIFHHYISDGWSQKLLAQQFAAVYLKVLNGEAVRLPVKSTTLLDWTRRMLDFAHGEAVRQIPYWLATIERARRCEIADEISPSRQRRIEDYGVHCAALDRDAHDRLNDYCRTHNVELTDLGTYALVKAFSRLTGTESLWVELTTHARAGVFPEVGIPDLFGQISESGAILFELPPGRSAREQIEAVRRQRLEAPNAGIGLRALRFVNQSAEVREAIEERCAPQVGLNFDLADYTSDAGEHSWFRFAREGIGTAQGTHLRRPADEVRLSFYVRLFRHEGRLLLTVAHHRDRFREQTITSLAEVFFSLMLEVVQGGASARPAAPAAEAGVRGVVRRHDARQSAF